MRFDAYDAKGAGLGETRCHGAMIRRRTYKVSMKLGRSVMSSVSRFTTRREYQPLLLSLMISLTPLQRGIRKGRIREDSGTTEDGNVPGTKRQALHSDEMSASSTDDRAWMLISPDFGMPVAGHFFLFRPAIDTAIKLSLERLGVDSIDLYMVGPQSHLHG